MKIIILIPFLFISIFVDSQCFPPATNTITTTYVHNNGQDGIMFDIVALNDVVVYCFDANFDPGTFDYEVYYKTGTAQGFDQNAAAWTLIGSGANITSAGNGNPTPIPISTPVGICAGTRAAFYITDTGPGADANYTNGTALNNVFISDANLEVREMYGKDYPFNFSYSPRVFNGTIYYDIGTGCSPLAVSWLSFDVDSYDGRTVQLDWSTKTETDNDYFGVQKFVNNEWIEIGQVKGNGTSTSQIDYSFSDSLPNSGVNYYRIKQVDFDGSFSFSEMKSYTFLMNNLYQLSPNPANDFFTVNNYNKEIETIIIKNSVGEEVKKINEIKGNQVLVKCSAMSSGVYYVVLNTKRGSIVKKLIIN